MYPLNIKNKIIIDEVFDKLQIQKRLKYITQFISFCFFIFMIHKTLPDDIDNNKLIINIKKFNQMFVRNAYLLSSQFEIIDLIIECLFVTVVNKTSFFYQ